MRKKKPKMKRIKNTLTGVLIPLLPLCMIVTSSGPRGGTIKSKKRYDRKRVSKKIKLWDDTE